MKKIDKIKNIQKANLIAEHFYLKTKGVINENYNNPNKLAKDIAGLFSQYIIPNSEKFTYGPDDEGTYHFQFLLGFDNLDYDTPEMEEEELNRQIGGRNYSGPGQPFSSTNVSFEGQKNNKFIFSVNQRGGYDI
jgi:hypothetical protein